MRHFGIAFILLASASCDRASAPSPDPASDPSPDQAPDETAPPASPPTAETPADRPSADNACDAAAFRFPPDGVVATINGEALKTTALSHQSRDAERDALHTYCREAHRIRQSGVRQAIDERLLSLAARQAHTTPEELLRTNVEAKVQRPDDAEIEAFYRENKTEQAPPLEQVKDQVVQAMVEQRSQAAYNDFISSLRDEATIKVELADLRPPAYDLKAGPHSATFGPDDAKLTIVEFSDFECPYCSRAADSIKVLKEKLGDRVQFAYRHFPLSFHPSARPAAEISQCAQEQDKFWPVHDQIFANQRSLSAQSLRLTAQNAGLDMQKLDECLESGRATQQVDADVAKAQEVGVRGTPAFYFNGRAYDGGISPTELLAAAEAELAGS